MTGPRWLLLCCALGVAASSGCDASEAGEATLRVTVYGEEFIEDRVPASDVIDGWEIEFSTFLVSIQDVSADGEPLAGAHLLDLTRSSDGAGHAVGEIVVPAGLTAHLDYRIAPAPGFDGGNADAQQQSLMAGNGYSMFVEGSAVRGSETKAFSWGFSNDTSYSHCHIDRQMSDGEVDTVEMTIHSDHLFYDDLDSEDPNVAFDIMARADTDADGSVSSDELGALDISGEVRYQVGSRPISDLWAFVVAQTATVGHIDGEGHCDAE